MENDPNKKESKGKRIFKKALRRNSKSSNSGQNSEQGVGISRSKSAENKNLSIEINDGTPLPKPDGAKKKSDNSANGQPAGGRLSVIQDSSVDVARGKKNVEIHESHNKMIDETLTVVEGNAKPNNVLFPVLKEQRLSIQDGIKRNLKRVRSCNITYASFT